MLNKKRNDPVIFEEIAFFFPLNWGAIVLDQPDMKWNAAYDKINITLSYQ